ncbi:hypothetical protein [Helicobacter bizzozeronii]|uniref:hypothetical protein n=1 Tax=Helicobacter bizzozeronii TaxID=56877 RepID=UPI001F356239|nr:hypothetical protein [Helicobacter bizzozeronii]
MKKLAFVLAFWGLLGLDAKPYYTTYSQDIEIEGQRYTLVSQTSRDTPQGKPLSTCLKIERNGQILHAQFCMEAVGKADFAYKKNYVTLEFSGALSEQVNRELYLTFKVVNGVFYLHQYSQQNYTYDAQGVKKILKTLIIYRQNRDDPHGENPITLDSLDGAYQDKLFAQCKENGYCM